MTSNKLQFGIAFVLRHTWPVAIGHQRVYHELYAFCFNSIFGIYLFSSATQLENLDCLFVF